MTNLFFFSRHSKSLEVQRSKYGVRRVRFESRFRAVRRRIRNSAVYVG